MASTVSRGSNDPLMNLIARSAKLATPPEKSGVERVQRQAAGRGLSKAELTEAVERAHRENAWYVTLPRERVAELERARE